MHAGAHVAPRFRNMRGEVRVALKIPNSDALTFSAAKEKNRQSK